MKSHTLIFSDFKSTWYRNWSRKLKQTSSGLEGYKLRANKFWQNAVMAETLQKSGVLKNSSSGVGFGVGKERLPALFASMDIKVTATDQDFRTKKAKLWEKEELAKSLDDLNDLMICEPKKFNQNVTLRSVDMRKIPKEFRGKYDFVWSNCALGHLGSIEEGLRFIVESAKCLNKSGVAVHTTEINVTSNESTVTEGETVVFRPRDLMLLSKRLRSQGFRLHPPKFNFGNTSDDNRISFSPEFGNDFSKILISGHLASQIVLIIDRPRSVLWRVSDWLNHRIAYVKNIKEQRRFVRINSLYKRIVSIPNDYLKDGSITPKKIKLSATIKSGTSKYIYIVFRNTSPHLLFPAFSRPYNIQPIVLETKDPIDRLSVFKADDWVNNLGNRPSSYLFSRVGKEWQKAEFVPPNKDFAFRVKLDAENIRPGKYTEKFGIVHENQSHLPDADVELKIRVS